MFIARERSDWEEGFSFIRSIVKEVGRGDGPWRAMANRDLSRSFAGLDGEDVFHSIVNIVESEICGDAQFVKEILEHEDHVVGEGMKEDGACFASGDGWFP